MKPSSCRRFDTALSGYVDGALDDEERERLLAHLVDCARCRSEVAQLRSVRSLLSSDHEVEPSTPSELTQRLVSIAGVDAQLPLWSRPFIPAAAGRGQLRLNELPSRRRTTRVRLVVSGLLIMTLTFSAAAAGYAAAPAGPAEVADPAPGAQAAFATAMGQLPLSSDALNAITMTSGRGLPATTVDTVGTLGPDAGSPPQRADSPAFVLPPPFRRRQTMSAQTALHMLRTTEKTGRKLSYRGMQQVSTVRGDRLVRVLVQVDSQPGQGMELSVPNRSGSLLTGSFVPQLGGQAGQQQRPGHVDPLGLLAARYQLSGSVGDSVAGRPTVVIEAHADGRVAGRWWVDQTYGLLLWQETYDQAGTTLWSAGFLSLQTSSKESFRPHLAPRLSVPVTTASLDISAAPDLSSRGWVCPDTLAGLSLMRLSSDSNGHLGVLQTVYGDGLITVSVSQQRGGLGRPPAGFGWDDALSAWTSTTFPRMASWQSGGTIFTVVTDGTSAQLQAAVRALPHQEPDNRTTVDRVTAGWARIIDLVIG